jgi:hypothetical protein
LSNVSPRFLTSVDSYIVLPQRVGFLRPLISLFLVKYHCHFVRID